MELPPSDSDEVSEKYCVPELNSPQYCLLSQLLPEKSSKLVWSQKLLLMPAMVPAEGATH
jgi:hypothetical protein